MKFNLLGYTFEITVRKNGNTVERVKKIVVKRLGCNPTHSNKISAIKILREYDTSKILIDGGMVPPSEINMSADGKYYVGLLYAKLWVEFYFFGMEDPRFDGIFKK